MNSKAIVVMAVLLVAAFAGIAVADDSDAAAGDTVTFTFSMDGSAPVEKEVTVGESYLIPDLEELGLTAPDGKQLAGWTADGTTYEPGQSVTVPDEGDKTLTAVLEDAPVAPATTTVSYQIGDRTYQTTESGATITLRTIEALGATVPQGKQFTGWKVGDTDTVLSAGSTVTASAAEGVTYIAQFEDVVYTVTFDVDGVKTTVTGTYNSAIPATSIPDTDKDGYIFAGWKVGDADPIQTLPAINADVTYVAAYTVDHKVAFVVEGTTILTTSVSQMTVPEDPAREGFEFSGWAVGGQVVDPVQYVKTITEDVTFTASWRADTLTVTFVSEGETVLTQTVQYGEKAVIPAMEPVKDGYDFDGWMLGDVAFDFSSPVTEDITLTAAFSELPEPEPTGLKDPVTLTLVMIVIILLVVIFAVLLWKKSVAVDKLVGFLTRKKIDSPSEEDKKE